MHEDDKESIRELLSVANIELSERQTDIICRSFELMCEQTYKIGKREIRDRLIEIVRPPKDVDTVYLEIICLIGEIE